MAAFADAMASASTRKLGAPSKLDAIRATLTDEARAELDAALADPHVCTADIWRALLDMGFDLCRTTVMGWCRKARRG